MRDDHSLEMDAITAHLDRGWDLLQRGELEAAQLSASHIMSIDSESPEGYTLLGAIAAARGEHEEALELFQLAIDGDPDQLDAYLYAAELAIHPLGDLELALDLCEEATVAAREPEEKLEIELLRAETLIAAGKMEEALAAAGQLQGQQAAEPANRLRAGRVLMEVGLMDAALELFRSCLGEESSRADARYFLGVALEMSGRNEEALTHFFSTYELDRVAAVPIWSPAPEIFGQLVAEVIETLPEESAAWLAGLPVRIFPYPPLELIAEGFDPRGAVLLTAALGAEPGGGGTLRQRQGAASSDKLSCIFVYQRNIERYARAAEDLVSEVQAALERELDLLHPEEQREGLGGEPVQLAGDPPPRGA